MLAPSQLYCTEGYHVHSRTEPFDNNFFIIATMGKLEVPSRCHFVCHAVTCARERALAYYRLNTTTKVADETTTNKNVRNPSTIKEQTLWIEPTG